MSNLKPGSTRSAEISDAKAIAASLLGDEQRLDPERIASEA